eukprot:TRINITY_DN14846_c0_g1_i1.p1 TRINITY_DN14846_c0_g1~~TRINITY_DN14846_c0_g1_i1.p1  ORF type:complete len:451 (+),score=112.81 TRINITY_DN14846_c0_g1_i1:92-1444(+)
MATGPPTPTAFAQLVRTMVGPTAKERLAERRKSADAAASPTSNESRGDQLKNHAKPSATGDNSLVAPAIERAVPEAPSSPEQPQETSDELDDLEELVSQMRDTLQQENSAALLGDAALCSRLDGLLSDAVVLAIEKATRYIDSLVDEGMKDALLKSCEELFSRSDRFGTVAQSAAKSHEPTWHRKLGTVHTSFEQAIAQLQANLEFAIRDTARRRRRPRANSNTPPVTGTTGATATNPNMLKAPDAAVATRRNSTSTTRPDADRTAAAAGLSLPVPERPRARSAGAASIAVPFGPDNEANTPRPSTPDKRSQPAGIGAANRPQLTPLGAKPHNAAALSRPALGGLRDAASRPAPAVTVTDTTSRARVINELRSQVPSTISATQAARPLQGNASHPPSIGVTVTSASALQTGSAADPNAMAVPVFRSRRLSGGSDTIPAPTSLLPSPRLNA